MKITKKSKIADSKQLKKVTAAIDWHEEQLDHPLFDLSGDAENQLHVWGEPSTQGRMGSIWFRDNDTDKTLYLIDYKKYCDFMDNLGYQYVHDKHPNDAEYVEKIVEFIKQYEYENDEDADEDDYASEDYETVPNAESIHDYIYTGGQIPYDLRDRIVSIIISKDVESISKDAFEHCTSLKSVTIPDSVTEISDSAFSDCKSLKSITIPDSVTSIGRFAFFHCDRLTNVTIPDSVIWIDRGVFFGCWNLTIHTNNPTAIEYAEKAGIPVVPLDEDLVTL